MTADIIEAFESARSAIGVRYLCEYCTGRADGLTVRAIAALARTADLDRERAEEALVNVARNALTPPDIAAAAADALDEVRRAGGE